MTDSIPNLNSSASMELYDVEMQEGSAGPTAQSRQPYSAYPAASMVNSTGVAEGSMLDHGDTDIPDTGSFPEIPPMPEFLLKYELLPEDIWCLLSEFAAAGIDLFDKSEQVEGLFQTGRTKAEQAADEKEKSLTKSALLRLTAHTEQGNPDLIQRFKDIYGQNFSIKNLCERVSNGFVEDRDSQVKGFRDFLKTKIRGDSEQLEEQLKEVQFEFKENTRQKLSVVPGAFNAGFSQSAQGISLRLAQQVAKVFCCELDEIKKVFKVRTNLHTKPTPVRTLMAKNNYTLTDDQARLDTNTLLSALGLNKLIDRKDQLAAAINIGCHGGITDDQDVLEALAVALGVNEQELTDAFQQDRRAA